MLSSKELVNYVGAFVSLEEAILKNCHNNSRDYEYENLVQAVLYSWREDGEWFVVIPSTISIKDVNGNLIRGLSLWSDQFGSFDGVWLDNPSIQSVTHVSRSGNTNATFVKTEEGWEITEESVFSENSCIFLPERFLEAKNIRIVEEQLFPEQYNDENIPTYSGEQIVEFDQRERELAEEERKERELYVSITNGQMPGGERHIIRVVLAIQALRQ